MASKVMHRLSLSHRFISGILATVSVGTSIGARQVAPQIRHLGSTDRDATMSCIRELFGKPALWDRVGTNLLIQPCPATRTELTNALGKRGLRLFDAQDFMFVIPEKLFDPSHRQGEIYPGGPVQAWQTQRWTAITVHLHMQKWRTEALPVHASEIAKQILDQARMIPLAISQGPAEGTVDADVNIAIWQGNLGPGDQESVIACINGQGRTDFSTARLVYGELRDGQYVMLWDSPLFNILHGNIYFKDVNGDGWKEIVIDSTNYGNQEYPMEVIFDHNGREITRQRKCEMTIAADGNLTAEDGTCPIFGHDVEFSSTVNPPADPEAAKSEPEQIYVTGWYEDGKNHVFELSHGIYVPGPPVFGPFPPAPPMPSEPTAADAAQDNQQGMNFMRQKNYSAAELQFARASLITGDKNPLYANNEGFAYYKAEQYDMAIWWLQKTVQLDPKRAVAYLNLGDALAKLDCSEQARARYRKALGDSFVEVNCNPETARAAYQKYLELAPNSKAAPDVRKKLAALPASP